MSKSELKDSEFKCSIKALRKVVKKFKKSAFHINVLEEETSKKIHLDVKTRWSSLCSSARHKTSKRHPSKKSLMIFMKSGTFIPNLIKIVDSLLTISPTSTSCERCFSTCVYILTPFRSKMRSDLLDSIVLPHLFI